MGMITKGTVPSPQGCHWGGRRVGFSLDCKTVGFFLKISKEIVKAWRKSLTRDAREPHSPQPRTLFSASFQTFCLTARAYLNTQKYGLFCSLDFPLLPQKWPLATFIGNKRKIEPKDKPRSSIHCLPAVYSPVSQMVSYPSVQRWLLLLCFPLAFCYNIWRDLQVR